jgi:hypothetical protein
MSGVHIILSAPCIPITMLLCMQQYNFSENRERDRVVQILYYKKKKKQCFASIADDRSTHDIITIIIIS